MSCRRLILSYVLLVSLTAGCLQHNAQREAGAKSGINDNFSGTVDVDKYVGIFEGESREIFKHRARILEALKLRPGMAVADIGAGTGFFSMLFAKEVGSDGKVYAVDIADDFLKHIRAVAKQHGLANISTVRCSQDSAKLPPESIDLAFICDVYHHFEHPGSTMRSIHRALRPGGVVVVIDFKRIEGDSREWVLDHVRAGEEETTREIVAEGFEVVRDVPEATYLEENYMVRFRKKG